MNTNNYNFLNINFKFICNYDLIKDIIVIGNTKELGSWNNENGIKLIKSKLDNRIWSSNEILIDKNNLLIKNEIIPLNKQYKSNKIKPSKKYNEKEFKFTNNNKYYFNRATSGSKSKSSKKSINISKVQSESNIIKNLNNSNIVNDIYTLNNSIGISKKSTKTNELNQNYFSTENNNYKNLKSYFYYINNSNIKCKGKRNSNSISNLKHYDKNTNTSIDNRISSFIVRHKNLEYKYILYYDSNLINVPNSSNFIVDLDLININRVILVNKSDLNHTYIESGLKFKTYNYNEENICTIFKHNYNNIEESCFSSNVKNIYNNNNTNKKKICDNNSNNINSSYSILNNKDSYSKSNNFYNSGLVENLDISQQINYTFFPFKLQEYLNVLNSQNLYGGYNTKRIDFNNKFGISSLSLNRINKKFLLNSKDSNINSLKLLIKNFTEIKLNSTEDILNNANNSFKVINLNKDVNNNNSNNTKLVNNSSYNNKYIDNELHKQINNESIVIASAYLPVNINIKKECLEYISNKSIKIIDFNTIEFDVSISQNSFSHNLLDIINKFNINADNRVFYWIGFIPNYFEILYQLNLFTDENIYLDTYNYKQKELINKIKNNYANENIIEYSQDIKAKFNTKEKNIDIKYIINGVDIINKKLNQILIKHNLFTIYPNIVDYNNFKIFVLDIIEPMINYMSFMTNKNIIQNYSVYYDAYKSINLLIADKINNIARKNSLIIVQNYHLLLTPSYFNCHLKNFKVCFWLYSHFPSCEVFRTFPGRVHILKSLLKCNLIGFYTYSASRNFIITVKSVLKLNANSNEKGQLMFSVYGRIVYILVQSINNTKDQLYQIMQTNEYEIAYNKIKSTILNVCQRIHDNKDNSNQNILKKDSSVQFSIKGNNLKYNNKYIWVSIDPLIYLSEVYHKLRVFKKFVEDIKDNNLNKLIFFQYLYEPNEELITSEEKELMQENLSKIISLVKELNILQKREILILKIKKLSLIEKLAIFANATCFLKVSRREPFNLDIFDFLIVKEIQLEKELNKLYDKENINSLLKLHCGLKNNENSYIHKYNILNNNKFYFDSLNKVVSSISNYNIVNLIITLSIRTKKITTIV